jgi:signal transduction histidine kinase
VAIERAADAHWTPHPARAAFRFEAYLATAVRVAGEPFGTLVFGSSEPRADRFTATHKDLLVLMAQWSGSEIERERLREQPTPPARAQRGVARRRDPGAGAAPGLDLSRALTRLEKRIRRAAGPRVEVLLKPAHGLPAVRALPLPVEQLVLSLVRKAVEAMPDGGRLVVSTAQREPRESAPGMLPPVAPSRYVTLCVRETGGRVDGDALSRIFEREPAAGDGDAAAPGLLSLAVLYRMLQRVGGDLSVELEPGRGSTFTVFLPLAETQETQAGVDSAGAPSGPPPLH